MRRTGGRTKLTLNPFHYRSARRVRACVRAGVCLRCVCLTHERACAADETEEAALGWKSPAFAADKDRNAVSLSAEILHNYSFLFVRKEEVAPATGPGLVASSLSSRNGKVGQVETAGDSQHRPPAASQAKAASADRHHALFSRRRETLPPLVLLPILETAV